MHVFERSSLLNDAFQVSFTCNVRVALDFPLQLRKPPFKNHGYAGVKMLRGFVLSVIFLARFDHLTPVYRLSLNGASGVCSRFTSSIILRGLSVGVGGQIRG